MDNSLTFKNNACLSIGVELELQLINLQGFNLAMEAEDFLRRLSEIPHAGEVKPEITKSMIEVNSSIHLNYASLQRELCDIRHFLADQAAHAHIGICGGGTHPFQKWREQRIYPTERFSNLSEQYGYLAKQFTVFGQHIHIACPNGDDALYLCHAMARYIPHFIVLAAASPFQQWVDTAFDCSRLTVISAFPLSGTPPWIFSWEEFNAYFEKITHFNIAKSMKDFYWDIRPKPEFGTVEIRICDTPLTIETAAQLAAYAQTIVSWLLDTRPRISHDIYLSYLSNRFQAARYGFDGIIVDVSQNKLIPLQEDILSLCQQLEPYAAALQNCEALDAIQSAVKCKNNGANWLRTSYKKLQSLEDVVRVQTKLWLNEKR